MSAVKTATTYALFAARVGPALFNLVRPLYDRFNGDVDKTLGFVKRIPEFWDQVASDRAARDAELEELRRQGK